MVEAIWLDIKLDQECRSVNNLGKFGDDHMNKIQVKERTKVKCIILTKSRAITQNLSNTSTLAKKFKMKTVWKQKSYLKKRARLES